MMTSLCIGTLRVIIPPISPLLIRMRGDMSHECMVYMRLARA